MILENKIYGMSTGLLENIVMIDQTAPSQQVSDSNNIRINQFFIKIEAEFNDRVNNHPKAKYHSFDIVCTNVTGVYRMSSFRIQQETINDQIVFRGDIDYSVLKCDPDTILHHTLQKNCKTIPELLNQLYAWLWNSTLCVECYNLIPANEKLCFSCQSFQIFWEFGLVHKYIMHLPTCSICFEPVFHSQLKCGHFFHKICFIGMNTSKWFTEDDEYQCPLCRKLITGSDKSNFFLYY